MDRARHQNLKTFLAITLALLMECPAQSPATERKPGFPPLLVGEPRTGTVLVASRAVLDANFAESIILLTEHGPQGSVGLIVNKETALTVGAALPNILGLRGNQAPILRGGPVSMHSVRLLVRSPEALPHAINVLDDVYLVNSMAILNSLLGGQPPATINYYAGYAGWGAGQLDYEIARGDWHLFRGDPAMIFTDQRGLLWRKLIEFVSGQWVRIDALSTVSN